MNLASWVLVAGVGGILAGVTFGESCAILSPIGFAYVGLLQALPPVPPAVLGDTLAQPQSLSKLLGLLIPTDFFTALSQNYVPAVVIFCIFYGVALQTLKDKAPLLSILEAVRLASLRFWNWIVRLAPLRAFALLPLTART